MPMRVPFPWLARSASRVVALLTGLAVCGTLARVMGTDPWGLLEAVVEGSLGSPQSIAATVAKLAPLLLNGLAVALAYRAGLLNIGCEGQMTLGALAAASFAARATDLPGALLVPGALIVAGVVGAAWAHPALWLRRRRNVHEVLTTLLLNTLALVLSELLVLGPLGDGTAIGRTVPVARQAYLPAVAFEPGVSVSLAPILALVLAGAAQAWLSWTVWGYETRATGMNPAAARAAGIDADRWQTRLFWLSGALAGLAGALEVLGVHHRFYRAFSPGYGFDGITVAFLANGSPGWLCVSGFLVAMLRSADKWLQLTLGLSPSLIWVIQAILLLSVACHARFDFGFARSMIRGGSSSNGEPEEAEGKS
jgi:general nucleoside transport system permease protein